ncbi:hypothetical protein [Bacillus coahuilensis]|nr:hypothetical protein [Bacillus coahuilensis]
MTKRNRKTKSGLQTAKALETEFSSELTQKENQTKEKTRPSTN